ncbi:hypothetical protein ACU4GD_19955 [Cupriavidus basilensis]
MVHGTALASAPADPREASSGVPTPCQPPLARTAHQQDPARLQPLGGRRDAGGLRAAFCTKDVPGKWSAFRVANTAFGAVAFLALEAIGAAITLELALPSAIGLSAWSAWRSS